MRNCYALTVSKLPSAGQKRIIYIILNSRNRLKLGSVVAC
jgi:hypothetical protein